MNACNAFIHRLTTGMMYERMPMRSMRMLSASFIHLSWLSSSTFRPSPPTISSSLPAIPEAMGDVSINQVDTRLSFCLPGKFTRSTLTFSAFAPFVSLEGVLKIPSLISRISFSRERARHDVATQRALLNFSGLPSPSLGVLIERGRYGDCH